MAAFFKGEIIAAHSPPGKEDIVPERPAGRILGLYRLHPAIHRDAQAREAVRAENIRFGQGLDFSRHSVDRKSVV